MNNKMKCGSCYSKEAKRRLPQKYIANIYSCLKRRVESPTTPNYNKLEGTSYISRAEFTDFSMNNPEFVRIYKAWQDSGCTKELQPSIDRIDSSVGYSLDNIQWMTLAENRLKDQAVCPVRATNIHSGYVVEYSSLAEAGRWFKKDSGCIFYAIKSGKLLLDEWSIVYA
jgi:hypothetical protein